jgi:hypothetical protein
MGRGVNITKGLEAHFTKDHRVAEDPPRVWPDHPPTLSSKPLSQGISNLQSPSLVRVNYKDPMVGQKSTSPPIRGQNLQDPRQARAAAPQAAGGPIVAPPSHHSSQQPGARGPDETQATGGRGQRKNPYNEREREPESVRQPDRLRQQQRVGLSERESSFISHFQIEKDFSKHSLKKITPSDHLSLAQDSLKNLIIQAENQWGDTPLPARLFQCLPWWKKWATGPTKKLIREGITPQWAHPPHCR